jgi:hypothetical protein
MAEKALKTRIQLKTDTEVNWEKAINFTPRLGEAIIYSIDNSHSYFDSHNRAVAVDDRFKEIHLEADANKNCIKLYKYSNIRR